MTLYNFPVLLEWNGVGGPGQNIWDLRTTGDEPGSTDADLDSLSDTIEQFYTDLLAAALYPQGYRASFMGEATTIGENPTVVTSPTWTVLQSGSTGISATATQGIITLRTASATRRGRGRKFLGPVAAGAVGSNGAPAPSVVSGMQAAADNLVAASTGFGNGAVGVYSDVDGVFRDLTGATARNYFAVLRSRRD